MNQPARTHAGGIGRRGLQRLAALALALLVTLALTGCGDKAGDSAGAGSPAAAAHSAAAHAVDRSAPVAHGAAHAEHAEQHDARAEHAASGASDHADHADHGDHAGHADHGDHAGHGDHGDHGEHANHDDHVHAEPLAAAPLPGTSIYHLATEFTDHHERALALPHLRGAPAVFVMFYGDCTTACPLLVRSAEQIEAALPEEVRDGTRFVMVSFDTERDTPQKLRAYAQDKGLDKENWHWLVGTPLQTRQLATLLGVQYRDAGNGVFAHSNLVTVVDPEGVPTARLEGIVVDLQPAIDAVVAAGAGVN